METTLYDGTVMLQGAGTFGKSFSIALPKRCSVGAFTIVGGTLGYMWPLTCIFSSSNISSVGYAVTDVDTTQISIQKDLSILVGKGWNFMGILE